MHPKKGAPFLNTTTPGPLYKGPLGCPKGKILRITPLGPNIRQNNFGTPWKMNKSAQKGLKNQIQ